jgi:Family of unknown function (DUF6370)
MPLKISILIISFTLFFIAVNAQKKVTKIQKADSSKIIQIVEVSCGQCQFKMTGQEGCDLAVKINGQTYFVDGTKIDDHGDAHAEDGFCKAIKKAQVKGKVVKGRFKATYFKLI